MNFVKLFTRATFDNRGFVTMCNNLLNVPAQAVEDGVVLDRDAFNAIPRKYLPVWAANNKEDINSPLHTRPATADEWPSLDKRYLIAAVYDGTALEVDRANGRSYSLARAMEVLRENKDHNGFQAVVIINRETNRIVKRVEVNG